MTERLLRSEAPPLLSLGEKLFFKTDGYGVFAVFEGQLESSDSCSYSETLMNYDVVPGNQQQDYMARESRHNYSVDIVYIAGLEALKGSDRQAEMVGKMSNLLQREKAIMFVHHNASLFYIFDCVEKSVWVAGSD